MEKLYEFLKAHAVPIVIITFILVVIGVIAIYRAFFYTYVTAEFKELRPFRGNLEVYYKGFKIGETAGVKPSENYKSSLMKLILYPKNLKLPKNITVKLKRESDGDDKKDFVDVIYPDEPDIAMLKDGDVITGIGTVDIESFFSSIETESLDQMHQDLQTAVSSLGSTIDALGQFFVILQDIAKENQPNIKKATDNLAAASKNFAQASEKLNRSLKQEHLDNTVGNVSDTTLNLRESTLKMQAISDNLSIFTNSLNSSMPQVNAALDGVGCIIHNLNEITCGVSSTMKKRAGGMRLFFGKVIDKKCTCGCK